MGEIDEKRILEGSIARAREGVGERIDELDRHLRTNYDPRTLASEYALQLVAGGAVVGLLVGFGMPKLFRRVITWGVPIAIVAMTLKGARQHETRDLTGLA